MGFWSNLFKGKKETQPIAKPKVMRSTDDIRKPKQPVYHTIQRTFQGTFVTGNPYNNPRNTATGRFEKKA